MNLNRVFLIGNLTRDPEVRFTPKGTAVVDLGLAVSRVYATGEGQKKEETTPVDVTLWARQAEVAGQYLQKGSQVFIEGRLHLDVWEQDGKKSTRLRVVGEHLQFLPQPKSSERTPAAAPARTGAAPQPDYDDSDYFSS
jgi:single-strand DNA-binding protein